MILFKSKGAIGLSLFVYIFVSCQPVWATNSQLTKPSVCSRILGAAQNFGLRFKNKELNEKAYKIIQKWEEIPLSNINSLPEQTSFVEIKGAKQAPFGVLGTLKVATVLNHGIILLVVDRKKRWHVFDTRRSEISIRIPDNTSPEDQDDIDLVAELNHDYFYNTELKPIGDIAPEQELNIDQMAESVHQHLQPLSKSSRDQIRNVYGRIFHIAAVGLASSTILWGGTQYARIAGIGTDSFLMQHSSNFHMGLAGMALIHSGLSADLPDQRGLFLSATIWGGVAFNIGTEIFGLDWLDMATGLFAVGLYYTFVGQVEKHINKTILMPEK